MWLVFQTLESVQTALDTINTNYGFPDDSGTISWDTIIKAHEQDLWYIKKPSEPNMLNVDFWQTWADISSLMPPKNLDFST
ncbi:hypothetical protein AD998_07515 [bacterium 336/3]|nr:hypothetical protein AD998_07515 [bacterium 336/3]